MRTLIGYLVGLSLLACCTPTESSENLLSERTIRIVATTSIIADLVREIGGSEVVVESLMGPGVDPHLYKASARDVSRMTEADLVVYNGLHLEGKMEDLFEAMKERGKATIAVAEVGVPDSLLIASEFFQGNYDPHVWFDATLWAQAAHALANALGALDPRRGELFASRGEAYVIELMEVDAYVRRRAAEIPEQKRVLVTSHDAFGYFGRAYGFEVRGLQGISTALEAGTADVQDLATLVAERRIPAMFIESSVSPRGIEAVREAVKARGFEVSIGGTLYGDALGGASTPTSTYLGMIRHNIDTIVKALSNGERSRSS